MLLNLYRNGRDSIGFHADNEREFGPDPTITSLSLFVTRVFATRLRVRIAASSVLLQLAAGDLLVAGATQRNGCMASRRRMRRRAADQPDLQDDPDLKPYTSTRQ